MYRQVERQDRQASLQGGQQRQEGPQALLERLRDHRESPLCGFGADAPRD